MARLKGYRITTFTSVYQDGKFSHNTVRDYTVHAINETKAKAKIEANLLLGRTTLMNGIEYVVGTEFIYSVHYLGYVTKTITIDYDYDYEGE